jgi:2-polyprenyl-6-methoxyphenol hydroxylase-like FAD-dependent oxidoreductase
VVWCRTLELLDQIGLASVFVEAGMKINGGSMCAEGKRVVHPALTSDDSPFGFPLMIPQNQTERLLTEGFTRHGIVPIFWKDGEEKEETAILKFPIA